MPSIHCPLFIVGFMVSGKTTVGQQLANELGLSFIDLDQHIEQTCGQSLESLFRQAGEATFRDMERDALRRIIASGHPAVVATGGGTPCHFDNMDRMLHSGIVAYLHLSNKEIVARLSTPRRARRPLLAPLTREELPQFVAQRMRMRSPYYERAHVTVDANHFNISSLAMMIELVAQHRNG